MTETSYNKALAICRRTSGSLLRVEQVKMIDKNIVKTLSKHPVFRMDAKKGITFFFVKVFFLIIVS